MGYHIFMARKVQLTTLKNNAYAGMMNKWVAQEHVADEKLQAMQDKNDSIKVLNEKYDNDRDAVYEMFKGHDTGKAFEYSYDTDNEKFGTYDEDGKFNSEGYKQREAAKTLVDGKTMQQALDDIKSKYQNDRDEVEGDYSEDYQSLSDEESGIEKEIQILETHISEYTEEMSKVEQQEATEIKVCIPNYNGAGGGQG